MEMTASSSSRFFLLSLVRFTGSFARPHRVSWRTRTHRDPSDEDAQSQPLQAKVTEPTLHRTSARGTGHYVFAFRSNVIASAGSSSSASCLPVCCAYLSSAAAAATACGVTEQAEDREEYIEMTASLPLHRHCVCFRL